MITREEYEKAKAIVDEYETNEYIEEQRRADQMLDEDDPFYDLEPDCYLCGGKNGDHMRGCPEDPSPFATLIREGYD